MSDNTAPASGEQERSELRADCSNCFGLCCVALPFTASADFPVDKAAGTPCGNLLADFRCGIHTRLRDEGFAGCVTFDCFGAGQRVSHHTFGGTDWRRAPETARAMFDSFAVMRQLHELLWYLTEALELARPRELREELREAHERVERLTGHSAEALVALDPNALRDEINPLLLRTSELAREGLPGSGVNHRGADLLGADLCNADLRGASLRGACLIGARLTGADLRTADVIGADLRGADLGGADLRGSLFLTQPQVNAARGDARTGLPDTVSRPAHW
ncbi:pentapeptide repeat-containing protein [Actinopolyspora erythraea]|uniref:Pentapeptide repeat-containing protein n=1 Tax=Actinopolyspora erythraea TaxID=414996 RepID=A0A099D116_9ACTN|nr:pentapeptide repeat-containing protein [Actinopolyspora erythraea]ASU79693.1 pentapeptide repeat-containing protein [Actinopolyspora erythraea]KGI79492.1 hypothetical protein IL38_23065 [Actinopolyspora erythraea]